MGVMKMRSLSPRHPAGPTVPVIGMGTSETFDTTDQRLVDSVVSAALDAGSTLFDSSPMYGRAEERLGAALAVDGRRERAVVATKVWTPDDRRAEAQIDASVRFNGGRIELLQVHNMVEWRTRLDQIEARRDRGEVLLTGATHWQPGGFDDLEASMRTGRVDAIQIPYNPIERVVEQRLLPLAQDMGIGVLIMRPFAKNGLMRDVPRPAELAPLQPFGITTWAQALLAWGLAHQATTVSIPATTKPSRAAENAAAGDVEGLDSEHRELIARLATR
jgi:aryl-alcohol dehydrogenase-like predicted oxidoreductase